MGNNEKQKNVDPIIVNDASDCTYREDFQVSNSVRITSCASNCLAHIELIDEYNQVFAIATCDMNMIRFLKVELDKRVAERGIQ